MVTHKSHPLNEHREHLDEHLRRARETGEPVFITENGSPAAVVLSPQTYDRLIARARFAEDVEMIGRSLDDSKAGRVMDASEAMRRLAEKHGINFNR